MNDDVWLGFCWTVFLIHNNGPTAAASRIIYELSKEAKLSKASLHLLLCGGCVVFPEARNG